MGEAAKIVLLGPNQALLEGGIFVFTLLADNVLPSSNDREVKTR